MNFCSHCGSPQIKFAKPKGDSFPRNICENCGRVFYDNPRIIVGCLVIHQDKVLLCQRAIEPQYGLWNLPAGFLENGERVEEGAVRETKEESRAEVKIIKLHAVFSLPKVNQVYLHFLAKPASTNFGPTPESLKVQLFEERSIPWSQIAFHSTTYALRKYFEFGNLYPGVHIGSYDGKEGWFDVN